MTLARRILVVLIVTLIGLSASRTADAFGIPTTYEYSYGARTTVLWERDKGRCAMRESTCFALFGHKGESSRQDKAMRFAQLSRPTATPWAVGQTAASADEDMRWVVVDLRTKEAVLTTTLEAEARARFTALSGVAPVMMDARNGAPSRPVLWRTSSDIEEILTEDAPLATLFGAFWLLPLYLLAFAFWIGSICYGFRHHGDGTRIALGVASVLTTPFLPYVFWAEYLLLAA